MNIEILFEDDYLMVINKPAGVVVNRVETERGETIQDWLENNFKFLIFPAKQDPAPRDNFQNLRAGIVHRLDRETSGCLIIAKTPEGFTELQRQFKAREVKKEYLALVHGRVEPNQGTIKVPIARSHHDRDKFAVVAGGRASETGYEVISHYALLSTHYSLIRVFPKTGRTHQIRVHFKYFGHPLVSDEKYGGNTALEDRKWCPRIFLHAAKITFTHPVSKRLLSFTAPTPKDLEKVIKQLTI